MRSWLPLLVLLAACSSSSDDDASTPSGGGSAGASAGSSGQGGSSAGKGGSGAGAAGSAGQAGASAGQGGSGQSGAGGSGGVGGAGQGGSAGQGGAGQAGEGQAGQGGSAAGAGQGGSAAAGAGQGGSAGAEAAGMSGQGGASGQGGSAAGQGGGAACEVCEGYGEPKKTGPVGPSELVELSGLAASRRRPGVFYAHNDSGDVPRLFGLKLDGSTVGEYKITGAKAFDWEDIAAGPCPAGQCVFAADIGDNNLVRSEVVIYRIDEAALEAAGGGGEVAAEALHAKYPDGAHNAETLLADPASGDLFIVTKVTTGKSVVFRLSGAAAADSVTTLEQVAQLSLPADGNLLATGGDAHPCAPQFLLRTYNRLYEFRAPAGGTLLDAFAATPTKVPVAIEPQGEAVAYLLDGGYITSSEGSQQSISAVLCK